MSKLTVAELELLFTADTKDIDRAEKQVVAVGKKIESKPVKVGVAADAKPALESMDRVEGAAKKLVSEERALKLDADIDRATKQLDRAKSNLEDLEIKALGGLDVTANVKRAEAQIQRLERTLDGLQSAKSMIEVEADTDDASKNLTRLEDQVRKVVSRDVAIRVDAEFEKALAEAEELQKELRYLDSISVTTDVSVDVAKAQARLGEVEKKLEGLDNARALMIVEADPADALAGLDRVEGAVKRLVSQDTALRINANVSAAEAAVKGLEADLDYLRSLEGTIRVDADVRSAEAKLEGARSALRDLQGARAEMVVDVNEGGARQKLKDVADFAGDAGDDAGGQFGDNLIAALVSIPIAGAVIGVGAAAAKALVGAFNDGLQVEKRQDRLQALTGFDEADAARLARAAGEAYANTFGESIEANMDTARIAAQMDLVDEDATTRDAQKVVEALSGISDVLGEDVQPTARATSQAIRTGLVSSAEEFFDVLAAGARNGVNASEDLLDTFTEYGTHFRDLGLTAEEALGLLNQGLEGGAFNADKVADALKELTIRVKEGSAPLADLGLDAEDMARRFSEGGPAAREGLQQILTGLQQIEDPAERSRKAVEIFGTQAEDMAGALGNLDLSTAVAQLGQVEGAAQKMFDTLASNDASKVERAMRNIEVAADGVKGALAGAFAEPLGDLADWVSSNRGPMLQFFADLVNGAIDFGISATTSFGEFVSGPLAETIEGIAGLIDVFNGMEGRPKELDDLAASMRGFDDSTSGAVDRLEGMRDEFNGFAEGQIALGHLNDAALRTAEAIDGVGASTDGTTLSLEGMDLANLSATDSGKRLESQIIAGVGALEREIAAAVIAGESQANLTDRYNTGTAALAAQLVEMGLTEDQAYQLISAYGAIPETENTDITSNAAERIVEIDGLSYKITTLPDGTVTVEAYTATAKADIDALTEDRYATVYVRSVATGGAIGTTVGAAQQAYGGIVEFMAGGGVRGRGLTPMQSIAQMVPASTWRVVGDRGDVPEAYIPLDGSPRSLAILAETIQRMPGLLDAFASSQAAPAAAGGPVPMPGGGGFDYELLARLIAEDVADAIDLGARAAIARSGRRGGGGRR